MAPGRIVLMVCCVDLNARFVLCVACDPQAIGRCPKEKLFKGYVQLERDLGEIDRCRIIYRRVSYAVFLAVCLRKVSWKRFVR